MGQFYYNYQTLLEDVCCFKKQAESDCCGDCPTSELGFSCEQIGENPICFTATAIVGTSGDTDTIEYGHDLNNLLPYVDGACIPLCDSYGLYFSDTNTPCYIGDVITDVYFGGSGNTVEEVIASATHYTLEAPYTITSDAEFQDMLNSLGLPGVFFVLADEIDTDRLHLYYVAECGQTIGGYYILLIKDGNADDVVGIQFYDNLTCEALSNAFQLFTCEGQILYFRRTVTTASECCENSISTYRIFDIEGCGCYKIEHIETETITVVSEGCTTTTTSTSTTTYLPQTAIFIEQIKQTAFNPNEYKIYTNYIGDTPTHIRITSNLSFYDSGWLLYGATVILPSFYPENLINGEYITASVSFDGGLSVASTAQLRVLRDSVSTPINTLSFYDITAHPDFSQCQFATPFILAEFITSNAIISVLGNLAIGLDYTTGGTPNITTIGCTYSCVTTPPPIAKFYVVIEVNITP